MSCKFDSDVAVSNLPMHATASLLNDICAPELLWPTDGSHSTLALLALTAPYSHNDAPVFIRATDMEQLRRAFDIVKQDEARRNDFFEVEHQ